MSEPYIGQIIMFAGNYAIRNYLFCEGQSIPISSNEALFSILGTTYGGDGRTSFALPDLRGRTPIHVGRSNGGGDHTLGQKSGEETHTLAANEMPNHDHVLRGTSDTGNAPVPQGHLFASVPANIYRDPSSLISLRGGTVANVGGGQAHNNMQPFLAVNFCIALRGLFPSRN